ncbi:thiol reductant ABC exporter subunit CydD [Desulforamulus ruminis]|uniref:thiol reductant ABC exporter subunit CydD n=1 Tax=Desulforamulus ruminis TaxID=1564 RepID=UPI002353C390|nr:thiol reductant ABC exporter subunit CydD [Desulforamulus ruminis]
MIDRRLWREARTVRRFLFLTAALGAAVGLVAVFQALYLARVVNGAFLEGQNLAQVRPWLLVLLGLILLRAVLSWVNEITAHRAAAEIKEKLRRELLDRLLALGPLYARGERTGELVNLLVEGVDALEDYFARYLPQLFLAALIPVLILAFVFPLDSTTALILLFTAPLIPLFMILIGKWSENLTQRQWETLSRLSAHFLDVLQGLTTLKLFGRSKAQVEVLARISNHFRETTLGVLRIAFLSALMLEFMATISTALVAVALGLRLVYDRIPFEQAFFLLLLAPEFYLPLRMLGSQFHAGMNGVSAANRIFEVLETPVSPGPQKKEGTPLPGPEVSVSFKDVRYIYPEAEKPALQGLSFELGPGEQVALVGPSGAGKSTVAHLLLGFVQPVQGMIQVNGILLDQIPAPEWRQQVALVPQNPHLFFGTVADNILLGRPGASLDEVKEAARLSGAHEFIMELPRDYQTPVGEQGARLSGGQAQRLAIARAFLKNAPLLILDEPTAGLDPAGEQVIRQALDRLMQGRATLLIAHRLSTVRRASRILVLDQGRLVESGQHPELMQARGLYYRLVKTFQGVAS